MATRSRGSGKLDTYMYTASLDVCLPYTFDILLLCLLSLNTTHQLFATLSTPDSLEPQFLIIQFVSRDTEFAEDFVTHLSECRRGRPYWGANFKHFLYKVLGN